MTDKVFTGTYSDFKLVKTRQIAQIIIEIPIERAEEVLLKFGVPKPNEEIWVAVAAIKTDKVTGNARALKAIQQAGILCNDYAFGAWLLKEKGLTEIKPAAAETIQNAIRALTGVKSRSDWRQNEEALLIWERLYKEFKISNPS